MGAERLITPDFRTAIEGPLVLPFWLVFADFLNTAGEAAPLRVATIETGITWDSNFWHGHQAGLMDISEISETTDGQSESVTVSFDAIPSQVMASITTTQYQGRTLKIYRGVIDTTSLAVVADPELAFSGIMERDRIIDDGVISTIIINAVSQLSNQLKPRVYRYTHNDQQLLYPDDNDSGLEFLPELQAVEINWGTG